MFTVTIWSYKSGEGEPITSQTHFSGIGTTRTDENIRNFVTAISRHGHAITESSEYDKPWNHHVIGCGVGHDDAQFAERGYSMAAYYENGRAHGGRWWENPRIRRDYYHTG